MNSWILYSGFCATHPVKYSSYRGDPFYWWRKPEYPKRTTDWLWESNWDTFSHNYAASRLHLNFCDCPKSGASWHHRGHRLQLSIQVDVANYLDHSVTQAPACLFEDERRILHPIFPSPSPIPVAFIFTPRYPSILFLPTLVTFIYVITLCTVCYHGWISVRYKHYKLSRGPPNEDSRLFSFKP
jgi:hypothetical protein